MALDDPELDAIVPAKDKSPRTPWSVRIAWVWLALLVIGMVGGIFTWGIYQAFWAESASVRYENRVGLGLSVAAFLTMAALWRVIVHAYCP